MISPYLVVLVSIFYMLRYKSDALHGLQYFRRELLWEHILRIYRGFSLRLVNCGSTHP